MLKFIAALIVFTASLAKGAQNLETVFQWDKVDYNWPTYAAKKYAVNQGLYIPENNLPLGLDRWNDKLFITVPRWKGGVPSSLNYISLSNSSKSPLLIPYPDWRSTFIPKENRTKIEDQQVVSTFRVNVDACDRLWVVDTGLDDILGAAKQITKPALVIFDLNTDRVLRRVQLKDSVVKQDSFFGNIIVDVDKDKCGEAFAYLPDPSGFGIVVYSWQKNDFWRATHNFFYTDPLKGDFNVGGINFQWSDGVFGLAIGGNEAGGYHTLYFHALASNHEFSVSSRILQNETLATNLDKSYHLYNVEGNRGENTQSSTSVFDEKSNVLFLTQVNRDGLACWNPRRKLNSDNLQLLASDHDEMIFTNELKIDRERNLWIFPDQMPVFLFGNMPQNKINYRVFRAKIDDIIAGTKCEV